MATDYIPAADAQFQAWQINFVAYVNAHLADLGLGVGDVIDLNATAATWMTDYPAHTAAQTAAQGARQAKDGARDGFEGAIRPLVRRLQVSPDVDDSERAAMGITVPDREGTPEGPPTTRPVVSVDTSQRLQHTIAFADEATPTRKAKPDGVMGAEIWVKVGDPPPTDPSELSFLSVDTRTPYVANFAGAEGGQRPPTTCSAGSAPAAKRAPGAKQPAPRSGREGEQQMANWESQAGATTMCRSATGARSSTLRPGRRTNQ